MLKKTLFICAIIFSISLTGFAQEKQDDKKKDSVTKSEQQIQPVDKTPWNKVCPVKGNQVESDSPTVEYNGKVYGFCCPGCDPKFAKNPEKYAKNLSEDGKKFVGKK